MTEEEMYIGSTDLKTILRLQGLLITNHKRDERQDN